MLWMAFQTNSSVDLPGSGLLAYSLVFGRQKRSWSILVRRLRPLDRRAGGLPRAPRRVGAVRQARRRSVARSGPLRRRTDRRRRGVPGRHCGDVNHPRQTPEGHGTAPGVAGRVPLRSRYLDVGIPGFAGYLATTGRRRSRRGRPGHRGVGGGRGLAWTSQARGSTSGRAGSSTGCHGCSSRRPAWSTRAAPPRVSTPSSC